MCGFFGAAFLENNDPVDVRGALTCIAHRGPDASGVWTGSGVALGHVRLAVLDLTPGGAQPMQSPDGGVVVVFNGEIYNHHALRRELEGLGHHFRSRSDTEVIVEGYRAWGAEVVARLDGMFAFAVWDVPRRRLLLARDRAGKKPLFYTDGPGPIRFASEAKAILAAGVEAAPNVDALPFLLTFGYTPAPWSMYRGIVQLPPASYLVAESDRPPRITRYWRAPFAAPQLRCTVDEAAAGVRERLVAAVKRRLEADVPLGAFLSGGLDSTIVVGIMSQLSRQPVRTFSIGFAGDPRFDETHYARIASRRFGTDHTEFTLEPSSFNLVERLVELHDGPFGDSSAIPTYVVSQLTRQRVTVALTGDGGDELFCGYLRFLAAEAAERTPRPLRLLLDRVGRHLPSAQSERSVLARARRLASAALLPLPDRLARLIGYFTFDLDALLRPELLGESARRAPLAWNERVVADSEGGTTLGRILGHNFETYLPYDLLVKADRASMAHGLETRSPFLDTALVEYVARLPDHLKRRGLTTKWIMRRACADLIPDEIMRRGKMGFGVPLGTWFRGDLKAYLEDHLRAPGARVSEFLQPEFVGRVLDEHLSGRADHGHKLWLLLTLELWLRSLSRRRTGARA
jgi:asparagine synthase (glutamine-hydrolysing)